jgi:hypothetical protein
VRSLLVGIEAYQRSKPFGKWRTALVLYAPLPEHVTGFGRLFMNSRAPQVAKLARELTRKKTVTADRVLALLGQRLAA